MAKAAAAVNAFTGVDRRMSEIGRCNGAIVVEMWCNRVEGQIVVAADTITVMTGQATDRPCPPERAHGDAEFIAALTEVTNWQWQGHLLVLIGPRKLHFRLPTN